MPDFSNLLPPEEVLDDTQDVETEEFTEEQPEFDLEADSEGEGEARSEGDAAAEGEAEPEPQPVGDGKTIPTELKELMAAHPDRAKLLKDLYFTNARYNKFGKVADLQKLKDLVDGFGSVEEATALQERLGEIGDLDGLLESHNELKALNEKFTAGDPGYVDHLAKASPESFAKLAPSFLQRFGNDHPDQYNYLMSQVVMSTLINNGTLNGLSLLQQAAASGNLEQVKQVAAQISESLGAINSLSQKAPQLRQADPRAAQLDQERQQFQRERQEAFVSDVKGKTAEWVSPEITKTLTPYGKSVTPGLAKRLDLAVKDEIGQLLGQNSQFQTKIKAAIQRGDRDGALRIYRQFVQPLVGNATRKVAAEFGLKSIAKKNGSTNGQPQPQGQRSQNATSRQAEQGWERTTKYPDVKDVNRDHPDYYKLAEQDKFILKSGRRVHVVS